MKFALEMFLFAWKNLWRTKLRTIFTIAGVLIGSGAIMTMVSLGAGLQSSITGAFSQVADLQVLEVMPGYNIDENSVSLTFNMDDVDYPLDHKAIDNISSLEGVDGVTPIVNVHGGYIRLRGENHDIQLVGMDFSTLQMFGFTLEDGSEIHRKPRGVLVGSKVRESMGKSADLLTKGNIQYNLIKFDEEGAENSIRRYRFMSMGVLEERSSMEDYSIIVPIETALDMLEWLGQNKNYEKDGYDNIRVKVASLEEVDRVTKKIQEMGFLIFSLKQVLEGVNVVFLIVQIILGSIGAIALVVAGLGIVNTMIMSIYERTKEIGIMKVVGASLGDIRNMFILEAGIIGLLGGIGGIISGWLLGHIIDFGANLYIASMGGERMTLVATPPGLILFILIFSILIGILSGLYPALKAMKLSPLSAIRQE